MNLETAHFFSYPESLPIGKAKVKIITQGALPPKRLEGRLHTEQADTAREMKLLS